MIGQYMMVDNEIFERLLEADSESIYEIVGDLSEDEQSDIYDVDKLWDGLHFLLTGKSASEPIEDDRLSEAIVGTEMFITDDADADYIAYIRSNVIPDIAKALKTCDLDKLRNSFDLSKFRAAEVYPDIWEDNEKDSLFEELLCHYRNLHSFYEKAVVKNAHVVVSIY
jgi:Domain of unknown function (DUF1877)